MVDGSDLVLGRSASGDVPVPAEGNSMSPPAAAYPALLIETDGYTYHSSRPDWHSDRLRDQAARSRSYPLRLTSDQVLIGRRATVSGGAPARNSPDVTL